MAMPRTKPPPTAAAYEAAQASAGNRMFAPSLRICPPADRMPALYEDGAMLLRLLLKSGLKLGPAPMFHRVITRLAVELATAAELGVSHTDCAEFMLYRFYGFPRILERTPERNRHFAIIGTFYANLMHQAAPTSRGRKK